MTPGANEAIPTAELLRQLVELTEADHLIIETGRQLERYPALLRKMEADEKEQQDSIAAAEGELETARHDRRNIEKDIAQVREHQKKLLAQQLQVKTNKEYEAMKHEIQAQDDKIDQLETRGLELLEAEDAAQARQKAARERLAGMSKEHAAERQRIESQVVEKNARLESLQREREERLAALPDPWGEDYTILNDQYPGTAAAPLAGGHCGVCNWEIVPHIRQAVHEGHQITRCNHCRRVLYLKEGAK